MITIGLLLGDPGHGDGGTAESAAVTDRAAATAAGDPTTPTFAVELDSLQAAAGALNAATGTLQAARLAPGAYTCPLCGIAVDRAVQAAYSCLMGPWHCLACHEGHYAQLATATAHLELLGGT